MTDPIRTKPQIHTRTAAPALTVQFHLDYGTVILWPVPQGQPFSLASLIINVRSSGFFIADDIYIPNEKIACIGMSGSPAKIQQPTHPTRQ